MKLYLINKKIGEFSSSIQKNDSLFVAIGSVEAITFKVHFKLKRIVFNPTVRRISKYVSVDELFIAKRFVIVSFKNVIEFLDFIFFAKPIDQTKLEAGRHWVVVAVRWIVAKQPGRQILLIIIESVKS